jgi:flagellar M-ring protein FliF
MDQLKQLLARLTLRQKITIAAVAVAVIGGLAGLSKWSKERDFKPLLTNLSAEDAGQAIARLRESGVEYRLSDNGSTILAPSAKIAELRLQLAAAGLPKSGRIGFELFDRNNFGATDFTEQVNYRRALEGELERSVASLAEVEQARVHLTFPKESIYTESRQPAKASVLVKLRPGARLSSQNVLAICNLTASAVEGLAPEFVSVLDMQGNLLNRPKRAGLADGPEPSDAAIEYRQKLERDLLAKIASTLDPLLGPDKYRAGVSVECDFTSGEQSEETFDPTKSVMVSSQRTEDGATAAATGGVPGTASNLPRPASRPVTSAGGVNRRTENIAYQSSRVVRHLKMPQGSVKRISISVLLDQAVRFENGKKIIEPPPPDKLKIVKDLVAGIGGVQPERGDQVIVESFPFEATLNVEAPAAQTAQRPSPGPAPWGPAWLQRLMGDKNFPILAGIGAAAVLCLIGGLAFVLRSRRRKHAVHMAKELPGADGAPKALEPASDEVERQMKAQFAEQAALKQKQTQEALNNLKLPPVKTKKAEVLLQHIGEEARKDPAAMAQVVRSWLNASDIQS